MKKVISILVVLCMVIVFAAACAADPPPPAPAADPTPAPGADAPAPTPEVGAGPAPVLRIATLGPLTGRFALYGNNIAASVQYVIDQINESGGIQSMGGATLELTSYDDAGDPNEGVVIANRIVDNPDYVAVIGPFNTAVGLAIKPLFNEAGIPLISPSISTASFAENVGDFMFGGALTMVQQQEISAQFITSQLGYTRGILMAPNHENGRVMHENFERFFTQYGGELVAVEFFEEGTRDFRPQLTRLRNLDADFITLSGTLADLSVLVNQIRELRIDLPFISGNTLMMPEYLDIVGENAEGHIMLSFFSPATDNPPAFEAFRSGLAARGVNIEAHSFNAADIMLMLQVILEEIGDSGAAANTTDIRNMIRDAIPGRQGVQGLVLVYDYDASGQMFKPMVPVIVRNGEFVLWTG